MDSISSPKWNLRMKWSTPSGRYLLIPSATSSGVPTRFQVPHVGGVPAPLLVVELPLELLLGLGHGDHDPGRLPDLIEVPPGLRAVALQHPEPLLEEVDGLGPGEVDGVGVFGRHPEGEAAGPADPDGNVGFLDWVRVAEGVLDGVVPPLEGGLLLGPHPLGDLDGLLQLPYPDGRFREGVSVGPVLDLLPAGADAEVEAAAADVVDGGGDVGEEGGAPAVMKKWSETQRDSKPRASASLAISRIIP
jgi:hypothetical protein